MTTGGVDGAASVAGGVLQARRLLITGGSGSLGRALVERILQGRFGKPARITIFSRDEAKQDDMREELLGTSGRSARGFYPDAQDILRFQIGDVREPACVTQALLDHDLVVHAAAMKQLPTCERFPSQAVATNIQGAENIVRAIQCHRLPIETVIGISTDKACKPVSVLGMTKAVQERLLVNANLRSGSTRFACVRYGNVLASRGSVIPLFRRQIQDGGPLTITDKAMTRFLVTLDRAVRTIMDAFRLCGAGEILVSRAPSCKVLELAECLIGDRPVRVEEIGRRPGEKIHETLVTQEELSRTRECSGYYVIGSAFPELAAGVAGGSAPTAEYTSRDELLSRDGLHRLLLEDQLS